MPLAPITAATPERCYVLDLMHVGGGGSGGGSGDGKGRWVVVELNPFLTSSSGHRFSGAEYMGLKDRLRPTGLPELRLLERTPPLEEQTAAAVPARWRELLEACGDRYDVAEDDFECP